MMGLEAYRCHENCLYTCIVIVFLEHTPASIQLQLFFVLDLLSKLYRKLG